MAECGDFAFWRDPAALYKMLWYGVGEHIIIQLDFLFQAWRVPKVEYTIPLASYKNPGVKDGYADLASLATKSIWEIKPDKYKSGTDNSLDEAKKESCHYVKWANQKCGSGWVQGVGYTTLRRYADNPDIVFRFTDDKGEEFKLFSVQKDPGAVIYHWEDKNGQRVDSTVVSAAARAKVIEEIYGPSAIPLLYPPKRGRRIPAKPRRPRRPAKTPQTVKEAKDQGYDYDDLLEEGLALPFMATPSIARDNCSTLFIPHRELLETWMQTTAVPVIFEGEKAAVILEESAFLRIYGEMKVGDTVSNLQVKPPSYSFLASPPRPTEKDLLERIETWWNQLSQTQKIVVAVGVAVVVVATAWFFIPVDLAGAAALGAGAVARVVMAMGTMSRVGLATVVVFSIEKTASAESPQTPDPRVKSIGDGIAAGLSTMPRTPVGMQMLSVGVPEIAAAGVRSFRMVFPQFTTVDEGVGLHDPLTIDGVRYRVIAVSGRVVHP